LDDSDEGAEGEDAEKDNFFFVGMRDLMSMGKGVSMLKDSLVAMIWEFGARRGV
jgi:hypothetical protein